MSQNPWDPFFSQTILLKKSALGASVFRLSLLLATGKRYSKKAGERGADVDAINESVELADEIYNGVFRKVCRHVDSCDDCNEV